MSEREDPMWQALAEQAREKVEKDDLERFDSRWDDYCAGRLSDEEVVALLAERNDPDIELASTLFEPLEQELKASLVQRLQQETLGGRSPQTSPEVSGFGRGFRDWLGGWLMFERQPRLSMAMGGVAALLLALGVFMMQNEVGNLPPFALELEGIQTQRSATDSEGGTFKSGHRFDFRLRPSQSVQGPIVTTVVVQGPTGEFQRWEEAAAAERSPDGAVLSKGLKWPWGAREWTVHFFLARHALEDAEIRRFLADDPSETKERTLENGRWMKKRIHVQP